MKCLRSQAWVLQDIDSIGFKKELADILRIKVCNILKVPYELMVEFAFESMERLNNPFFYVNGYTNGCLSYFPTEEEYDRGGYEVYWSLLIYYKYFNRVFPFERDSASKLINFIIENAPMTERKLTLK